MSESRVEAPPSLTTRDRYDADGACAALESMAKRLVEITKLCRRLESIYDEEAVSLRLQVIVGLSALGEALSTTRASIQNHVE